MKTIANAQPLPSPTFTDADGLEDIRAIAQDVAYNGNDVMTLPLCQEKKRRAPRRQYRFWLEGDKPIQCDLAWWIEELKDCRRFAPVIRDALLLYREFMRGEVAMLYELFPKLNPPPPPVQPKEVDELKQRITILENEVDLLRGILINQKLPTAIDTAVKMSSGNGVNMASGAGERTPRVLSKPPIVVDAPVVREVDTSEAFLNAF